MPISDYVSKVMIGIVRIENSVLVKTHLVPYTASAPYFAAKRAVVVPAGMAVRITEQAVTISSAPITRITAKQMSGSASRRTIPR